MSNILRKVFLALSLGLAVFWIRKGIIGMANAVIDPCSFSVLAGCAAFLTFLIIGIAGSRIALLLNETTAVLAAACFSSLSMALAASAVITAGELPPMLLGFSSTLYLCCLSQRFMHLNNKSLVGLTIAGFIVGFAITAIAEGFPPLLSSSSDILSPVFSALLLVAAKSMESRQTGTTPEESANAVNAPLDPNVPLLNLAIRSFLAILIVAFANGLVYNSNLLIHEGSLAFHQGIVWTNLLCALFMVFGSAIIGLVLAKVGQWKRSCVLCYHGLVLFMALVLLLPLTGISPTESTTPFAALHLGSYGCFSMFIWILSLWLGKNSRFLPNGPLGYFCFGQVALRIGLLLGQETSIVIFRQLGSDTAFTQPVILAGTVLVLLAYLVVFDDHALSQLLELATPITNDGWFIKRCSQIASENGLSKRQTEVMVLFAKGRNLKYISEQLVISPSTVSMHRQHIYQKLDIHSQQELIDLIEKGPKK